MVVLVKNEGYEGLSELNGREGLWGHSRQDLIFDL